MVKFVSGMVCTIVLNSKGCMLVAIPLQVECRTRDLGINIMQYNRFGKNFIKTKALSPDALMQLAFQVGL